MPRRSPRTSARTKSPFPGPPDATLRWIPVDGVESHSPDAKMSDTLLHFLDPLLEFEPTHDPTLVRNVLEIGVAIWNLGSFEMPQWKSKSPLSRAPLDELRAIADDPRSPEGFFQIAEALLHRRRTLFEKDLRCIVDFEILPDPHSEFRLRCTFALPDP